MRRHRSKRRRSLRKSKTEGRRCDLSTTRKELLDWFFSAVVPKITRKADEVGRDGEDHTNGTVEHPTAGIRISFDLSNAACARPVTRSIVTLAFV
jgi:hypothetical protein